MKLSFHTPEFNYLAFARTPELTLAFAQIESVPTNGRISTFMEKELQELKELHQFYLYHDYKTGEIAKELNVSTRTVQRWLSGKATPSEEKLKQLRKLLNKKRRR